MSRPPILRLTRDSITYGIGQAVGRAVQIVLVPVFTRVFRPDQYGVVDVLTLVSTIAAFLIVMGTDAALGRFFYEADDADARRTLVSTLAGWRIGASLAVALVLFALAPFLSRVILASPDYAKYVRIMACSLPFTVFVLFENDVLRVTLQPPKFIVLNLLNTLAVGGLSIWFVVGLHRDVSGVLFGRLVGDALTAVAGLALIRHSLRLRFDRPLLKRLLTFAVPLLPAVVAFWAISYADRAVLVHFTTLADVGVYAVAVKVSTLMLLGISAFQLAWGPFAYAHSREPGAGRTFARVLTLYAAGASLLALALGLFAPEALALLVPAAYRGAAVPGGVLAFSAVAFGAYTIVGIGANLAYRTILQMWCCLGASVVTVGLALWLVRPLGLLGVAAATLLGFLTSAVSLYVASQSVYPFPYRGQRALLLFGLALATWALAAWGGHGLAAGGRYGLGVAVRGLALVAFGGLAFLLARRIPLPAEATGEATTGGA